MRLLAYSGPRPDTAEGWLTLYLQLRASEREPGMLYQPRPNGIVIKELYVLKCFGGRRFVGRYITAIRTGYKDGLWRVTYKFAGVVR